MQQSQQVLLSVRDKIPQPNSLLPGQMLRSQSAQHLLPKIRDIRASSSVQWPLDQLHQQPQEHKLLNQYYDCHLDINCLLNHKQNIAYLNPLALQSLQTSADQWSFGTINTLKNPPKHKYSPYLPNISQLQFDDCIQSGNLYFALKHDDKTYILGSRLDYNTFSYGQWFYFKVRNRLNEPGLYQFYIVNMTKNGAMFGKGLKVSVCRNGVWGKQGTNIHYLPNKFIRKNKLNPKLKNNIGHYYTLCFSIRIMAAETIYIAYNQPYTYTRLGNKLDSLMCENMGRSVVCRTPLGNRIQMISFTQKNSLKDKKVIFIVGRTHPVETAGSFVIEGIINILAQKNSSPQVQSLLKHYIINIIPMVNPDGVILGNSRCNLYGYDLNRQWKNPNAKISPEVVKLKNIILKYEGRIEMFLDIHGHSKKKNVFAYGCHDVRQPYASRQFPYLLAKFSAKQFLFSQCRFTRVSDKKTEKDGTARISLWKKLRIPNIFTIENSYCCGKDSKYHYDKQTYGQIGKQILQALSLYFSHKIYSHGGKAQLRDEILKDLRKNPENIEIGLGKEDQSESQQEQRVQMEEIHDFYTKKLRKKQDKTLIRSKTQKISSVRSNVDSQINNSKIENQTKYKNSIRQPQYITTPVKTKDETQVARSISNNDLYRGKLFKKNLTPLNKRQFLITKCGGINEEKTVHIYQGKEKVTAYSPKEIKQKQYQFEQKNLLSVVDIGKESLDVNNLRNNQTYSLIQMHFYKNMYPSEKKSKQYRELEKKRQQIMKKTQVQRKNNVISHMIPTLKHKKMRPPSNIDELLKKFHQFKPDNMEKMNR